MPKFSVEIVTLFPELFDSFLQTSLVKKAIDNSLLEVRCTNIRDFADPPHYRVDDIPYGGGGGMLLKPEPLALAIEEAKKTHPNAPVVLMSPSGNPFTQGMATDFAAGEELILVCGRYEGVDQRVIELFIDLEVSIGDYVLMGGELPAMVVLEASVRLRDNVLGNDESHRQESFSEELLLEAPHYTRPEQFRGLDVPSVLLSGNHKEIKAWRSQQSKIKTHARRPDLLAKN